MKTLLIMRHAKSSWDEPGLTDHQRPLNERGLRDAPRMGQLIKTNKLTPDVIITSDALRAKTTAELVKKHCGCTNKIIENHTMYVGGPSDYISQLTLLEEDITRALLIGHNPIIEQLLFNLVRYDGKVPTAALAHIEADIEEWDELQYSENLTLVNFWKPKKLGEG